MLRLYDSRLSGNSWKVRILLNQLQLPYERITLDLEKGDTNSAEFQKISRFARVPVLELADGRTIVESGAILQYLAAGTPFFPDDQYLRAEVTSWMFFEQADLQRAIALPRVYHLRGLADRMSQQIERFHTDGYNGLEKLERGLGGRHWLVDDRYTIADLGVFAYVALASQGGYDMTRFPAILLWLARVKQQEGWIELIQT
ncbi:glutathione S-transferase family protein [Phyllobacterium bourgognense]|uniref:Glutathione S-transferase n=1 Tax=Phyllobacterium bourgognense TaxID=314236 RepID=A0A368YSP1_9HYPH|nr:glutathione S-transferase family protein [Phyllobacterium bourgognense]RCW81947.1 glutathione S-transferase [Phyllobacterium bourgognense]